MKNEKLVVASFALVTDLSDGVPMSKVSPSDTPPKGWIPSLVVLMGLQLLLILLLMV